MTTVRMNPYLLFRGQARAAIDFYEDVFGGELTVQTYAEGGMANDAANAERVMHAQLESPNGLVLMASDVPDEFPQDSGSAISISLSGDDEPTLRGYYEALADGGTVIEPLAQAPWGDQFGACVDRFGTRWMVNISGR